MTGELVGVFILLGAAFITDLRSMKIPNALTLSGLAFGLLWHLLDGGWGGGLFALRGVAVGFALMLMLYWFGAVGGGDVKLFAGIGAWTGAQMTLHIMVYSILCAGLIGVFILILRREAFTRLRGILHNILGALVLKSWIPVRSGRKNQLQFPFMLAVLPAAVYAVFNLS
ncbi:MULTISPECIES: A24 family peptidase [Paenibacillus]|uniref:A24 family peptidase n=1 Tax=Paenibacillus TaxID=44249 RepID=UPI002FDF2431